MMPKLSIPELYDVVRRNGGVPEADRVAVAAALAESGGDTDALGDYEPGYGYHSAGLWQLHDHGLGAGHSLEARCDPDAAASIMVPLFNANYAEALAQGYTGEQAARYACIWTERPAGWPDLYSPAGDHYAARWQEAVPPEEPMPTTLTYRADYPRRSQVQDWTCSVVTAWWTLNSLGVAVDAGTVQDEMVDAGLVTPAKGLLDGSGTALARWLQQRLGAPVEQATDVSWEWLLDRAGRGPIGLGGQAWNHWVAVRCANEDGTLALANPAPGYRGVGDVLSEDDFARLGPFAAIWIPVEAADPEEDMALVNDLTATLDDLTKRVAPIARAEIEKALQYKLPKAARAALERGALPAIATIERAGAPEEG